MDRNTIPQFSGVWNLLFRGPSQARYLSARLVTTHPWRSTDVYRLGFCLGCSCVVMGIPHSISRASPRDWPLGIARLLPGFESFWVHLPLCVSHRAPSTSLPGLRSRPGSPALRTPSDRTYLSWWCEDDAACFGPREQPTARSYSVCSENANRFYL